MTEAHPRVSLVMPSFNQVRYLEAALESVLDQDYPNFELIVVDGGSTDGSVDVIRRYEDRLASWSSERDNGQVDALTRGFARADGVVLGWLNSDDVLRPEALATAVAAFGDDDSILFVYGDNLLIDEHGDQVGLLGARPFDVPEMLRTVQNHVPQPGSLFRRTALERVGGLPDGYYYFDFELVVRIGLLGRTVRVEGALGEYRLHDESKSVAAQREKAIDMLRMYDAVFALPDLPLNVRAIESEARAAAWLDAGAYFYAALDQRRARHAVLQAIKVQPRSLGPRAVGLLGRSLLPAQIVPRLRRLRRR
jgi:glycosyltransferase involved in cell wall biosynthesis